MENTRKVMILTLILTISVASCIEIIDVEQSIFGKGTECYGTNMGFGFSGSSEFHYESLIRRYKGCKHVEGNLEITNLNPSANITYDLSFLSTIEVVTGYVLIGLLDVETIPLTNLKLIRADNMYSIMREDYGLVVVLNDVKVEKRGLKELQMPALREISQGRVLFMQNPFLNYVNTINWNMIVPGIQFPVTYGKGAYNTEGTTECDPACEKDGQRHCWGKGKDMCQIVHTPLCDELCPGRCYDSHMLGCCHPECAVGCTGPSDTDCLMCKYFRYDGMCVPSCPEETEIRIGQDCLTYP